jgi:hypothetical protein
VPETGNNLTTSHEEEILSIRLSTDGFSFYIYNPRRAAFTTVLHRDVNASISMTANLKREYQELELLQQDYRGVNIIFSGRRYTYVPSEMMDPSDADLVFHYNQQHQDNEVVMVNQLKNCGATVLFGIDKSTASFLREHLPSARLYAQTSLLCDYFAQKSRGGVRRKMYVSLRGEGVDILTFENGNLLIANSFDTARDADNIYYILATWQRLALDQEADELHLSGNREKISAIIAELRKYIKEVESEESETDIDIQELNIDYANY